MRLAVALWALISVVVPAYEAALSHRSGSKTHSSNVAAVAGRTGLRRASAPLSATVDAALRARSDVAKFGPGNCISTWRNADGHCEIETQCQDRDISKYAVKFICIDDGGEKVRHVFSQGSFDSEEQFDTLIECRKCLAEKEDRVEVISDSTGKDIVGTGTDINYVPPKLAGKKIKPEKLEKTEKTEQAETSITMLKDEVKQLEAFMMNTSAELQTLNKRVYSSAYQANKPIDTQMIGEQAGKTALTPPKSLVHHKTVHHRHKEASVKIINPLRVEKEAARLAKEHRRQIQAEEDGDDEPLRPRKVLKVLARKAEQASPPSLAREVKTAEARDEEVPAHLPPRSQMMLSHEYTMEVDKVVGRPKDNAVGADGYDTVDLREETSAPQPADETEHQDGQNGRPSISMLQGNEDDSDDDDSEAIDDRDENTGDDEESSD